MKHMEMHVVHRAIRNAKHTCAWNPRESKRLILNTNDRHSRDVFGSDYPLLKGMMTVERNTVMVESESEWRQRDGGSESNRIHAKDLSCLV